VYFQGNAPSFGGKVFFVYEQVGNGWFDPVTIYYLIGTSGWSMVNLFVPISVWQPQIQSTDISFGVKTNHFGFNVSWATGLMDVVEASSSLSNPLWSPVATNTLTGGSFYFTDPQWTNYPSRFYRVRSQ
jgi:hypothetical protein